MPELPRSASPKALETSAENAMLVIEGFALKKKRKKNQGYAKRFFKLTADGTLSYSLKPHSHIRETCLAQTASIGWHPTSKEAMIDSGRSLWQVRFLNNEDYDKWSRALKTYRKEFAHVQIKRFSMQLPEAASSEETIVDPKLAASGLNNLNKSIAALDDLYRAMKAESEQNSIALSSAASQSAHKVKTIFTKKGKEPSTSPQQEISQPPLGSNSPSHLATFAQILSALKEEQQILANTLMPKNVSPTRPTPMSPVDHAMRSFDRTSKRSSSIWSTFSEDDSIYHETFTLAPEYEIQNEDAVRDDDAADLPSLVESDDEDPSTASNVSTHGTSTTSLSVRRRSRLPAGIVGEETSILGLLRKNVGKDLSKVSMPISFNEPLSALQKIAEDFEHTELLREAAQTQDPIARIALIAAFVVSGFAPQSFRKIRKPFNPLLGETYELIRMDKHLKFVSEKVVHQPPILAAYAEDTEGLWTYEGCTGAKEKFYGRSLELIPSGKHSLHFKQLNETYSWNRPSTYLRNLIGGEKYLEFVGEVVIDSSTAKAELEFKEGGGGMWSNSANARNKLIGKISDAHGKKMCELTGRWNEALAMSEGGGHYKVLWEATARGDALQYGFTKWTIELNEITDDIVDFLPATDSRLRPDQRAFEEGDLDYAEQTKIALEQRQRERRADMESQGLAPRFFHQTADQNWVYKGGYFENRNSKSFKDGRSVSRLKDDMSKADH